MKFPSEVILRLQYPLEAWTPCWGYVHSERMGDNDEDQDDFEILLRGPEVPWRSGIL